jgi:hypothetical protein
MSPANRSHPHRASVCSLLLAAVALVGAIVADAVAQQPPRQLAPGGLTTIPPDLAPEETVSTHDIVEIRSDPTLRWEPEFLSLSKTLYGMSAGVKFRRDIWCLEFSFKPMRMIEIDVPHPGGDTRRQLVWYLVYRVRNSGQILTPVEGDDGVVTAELAQGEPVRFLPQFVLEAKDRTAAGERVDLVQQDRAPRLGGIGEDVAQCPRVNVQVNRLLRSRRSDANVCRSTRIPQQGSPGAGSPPLVELRCGVLGRSHPVVAQRVLVDLAERDHRAVQDACLPSKS